MLLPGGGQMSAQTHFHKLPPAFSRCGFTVPELPYWELTFISGGRPLIVTVRARNAQAAAHEGEIELAAQLHEFDPKDARLISAIQCR